MARERMSLSKSDSEFAEAVVAQLGSLGELPTDLYVGDHPAVVEEQAAEIAPVVEQRENDTESRTLRRQVSLLSEQLQAAMLQIQKLAAQSGGLNVNEIAREVAEQEELMKWERIYTKIKMNGGLATIVVHSDPDPTKNWEVPVGINGTKYRIPRGKPVKVPWFVIAALNESRVSAHVPIVTETGDRVYQEQRYLSYPFSLLDIGADEFETPVQGV